MLTERLSVSTWRYRFLAPVEKESTDLAAWDLTAIWICCLLGPGMCFLDHHSPCWPFQLRPQPSLKRLSLSPLVYAASYFQEVASGQPHQGTCPWTGSSVLSTEHDPGSPCRALTSVSYSPSLCGFIGPATRSPLQSLWNPMSTSGSLGLGSRGPKQLH